MTDRPQKPVQSKPAKLQKRASALRDNLLKRKEQGRAREAQASAALIRTLPLEKD